MPTPSVTAALARRVRVDGASPLVTYYDLNTGERTELSGRSFANWVDKVTNLLGTLDAADGGVVAAPLAVSHPGHWLSLVLPLAAWQAAASYHAVPAEAASVADVVVVVGPEAPASRGRGTTLACSLHPLALPLSTLPDGILDFTSEALAQPDQVWLSPPVLADDLAWVDGERRLRHRDVVQVAPSAQRHLVRPSDPWTTVAEAIAAPLLGGGSTVIVVGDTDDDRLSRIRASERCVE